MAEFRSHDLKNLRMMSDLEVDIFHKFLDIYDNSNVIVADKVLKDYPIFDAGERITLESSNGYNIEYYFKRPIEHEGNTYIVGINYSDLSHEYCFEPRVRGIEEIFIELDGNRNVYDIKNARVDALNKKQLSLATRVGLIFSEEKFIAPDSAYFRQLDTTKAIPDSFFLPIRRLDKVTKKNGSENKLYLTDRVVEGDYKKLEFATILAQLLQYRNNYDVVKSERFMKKLDEYILQLAKTEMARLVIEQSYKEKSIGRDFTSLNRVSKAELFSDSNGGLTEEVKTLKKIS